jgi:hypothetical protein
MDPLHNIFTKPESPIKNEDLKAYVADNLSNEEKHLLESQFNENDDFEQDAIEGLVDSKSINLNTTLLDLNKKIEKTLLQKKQKRKILNTTNTNTIAIITLLGLVIVGYIVVRMILKKY